MSKNTAQYDADEWGDTAPKSKPRYKDKQRNSRDSKRQYEQDKD